MEYNESDDVLNSLSLKLADPKYCDIEVTFKKKRKKFFVNSTLLAARSEVFEKMFFDSSMKEQQTKTWEIDEDIDFDHFQQFIDFIYTGKIKINAKVIHIFFLSFF